MMEKSTDAIQRRRNRIPVRWGKTVVRRMEGEVSEKQDRPDWILMLLCFAMGFCVAMTIATTFGRRIEEEAVKAGHAEYYLDQNNQRQWRWKEIK